MDSNQQINYYIESIGMLLNEGMAWKLTAVIKKGGFKDFAKILKNHQYPELMKLINSAKSVEDLQYLKKDAYMGINQAKQVKQRIELVKKKGDCEETHNFYKGINKKYIDKGVTSKDCDLYIEWIRNTYIPAINNKIKELKNK